MTQTTEQDIFDAMARFNAPLTWQGRPELADTPCDDTQCGATYTEYGECLACGYPSDCHEY